VTRHSLSFAVTLALFCSPFDAAATPPEGDPLIVSEATGETELSLGIRSEAGVAHREVTGFMALSVPFERLAVPRVASVEASPSPPAPLPPEKLPAEVGPPSARAHPLDARALAVLARGALGAARRAERAPERERTLDALASRARLSSLLPEVRLRAARTRDESLRLTPTTDDPYRFTLAGGDALVLEGAATFRLSRLLFADEELAVDRLRLERERNLERRATRVLERLLAWHAAVVRLASGVEDIDLERVSLELDAAAVELDVLTDGWFQARVARLGVLPDRTRAPSPPASVDPGGSPSSAQGAPSPSPHGASTAAPTPTP
jgi:hypothetical protein